VSSRGRQDAVPSPVRIGVVGVGYLGALHAEKYDASGSVDFVGVYDTDPERAAQVAARFSVRAFESLESLLAAVEAISIVVPTVAHAEVAEAAAARGVHVLIEKPLAPDVATGERIASRLRESGVVVQVGHLERFNPVLREMRTIVGNPRFIECHRLAAFGGRGIDTSVVYDVMIHDLDIIAFLVGEPVERIEAVGVPVLSKNIDIANARLKFRGGCIANVTASRVSLKRERKLRVFQEDAYVSMDFDAHSALIALRPEGRTFENIASAEEAFAAIDIETREFDDADPLREELENFVHCVRSGDRPVVGLEDGMAALRLAERVLESMDVPEDTGAL